MLATQHCFGRAVSCNSLCTHTDTLCMAGQTEETSLAAEQMLSAAAGRVQYVATALRSSLLQLGMHVSPLHILPLALLVLAMPHTKHQASQQHSRDLWCLSCLSLLLPVCCAVCSCYQCRTHTTQQRDHWREPLPEHDRRRVRYSPTNANIESVLS